MGEASMIAGNTGDGAAGGRDSEGTHELLAGVSKAFETAMDALDEESVEARINGAFATYFADHKGPVEKVERNGITISRNIVSASGLIERTDGEAEGEQRSAFPYLNPRLTSQDQVPPGIAAPVSDVPVGPVGPVGHTHLRLDVNR
ncbi:hypothetical protein [Nocardiopsis listeri]|uniref:hypothetical protein n=1 Tax=Nocardiopsis listeri TaxID=53440 RepID=UPI000832351B|nr:hypothetical protein [Nocardiopsis listeri]